MSRRSISLFAAATVIAATPFIALAQWQGPSGSPPANNASGPVWLQSGAPTAQSGSFSVTNGVTANSTSTNAYVDGHLGVGANSAALFTIKNNVAGATFTSLANFQEVLWTSGAVGATYGFGVQSNFLTAVSGGGGFRWMRAGVTPEMTLSTAGNLGINNDTPNYKLDVNGNTKVSGTSTLMDDVYTVSGKAIRTDGLGITAFNLGNWGSGAAGYALNVFGDVDVQGFGGNNGSLTATQLCLVGDSCITAWPSSASGTVTAAGTTNYIPKFTGSSSLGDSGIYNTAGNFIGIGTTAPKSKVDIVSAQRALGATGTTAGVWAVATGGVGGHFEGTTSGVEGSSSVGNGVHGLTTAAGAHAIDGVSSGAANGYGVYGIATGAGANGVYGTVVSSDSIGVRGTASTGNGVGVQGQGYGSTGIGVDGYSAGVSGIGVRAQGVTGLYASGTSQGVYGTATGAGTIGVKGSSSNIGGYFESTGSGYGLVVGTGSTGAYVADAAGDYGYIGMSGTYGVYTNGNLVGTYASNGSGDDAYLAFNGYGLYTTHPVYMGGGYMKLVGGTHQWHLNTRTDNGDLELIPGNNGVLDSTHRLWLTASTGHVVALGFDNWSDARLKNIKGIYAGGLDVIEQLQPKNFTWKADAGKNTVAPNQVGFIAQEVQKVLPDAVVTETDPDGTLAINPMVLTATLVNAVKEQQQEIKDLQSKYADLEARLNALSAK